MAASSTPPRSATRCAAPAVSASITGSRRSSRRMPRTWPSATGWLCARFRVASVAPVRRQQAVLHPLEMLAHDGEAALRQQAVDVGHPAGEGVLAGQHGQRRLAAAHRVHRRLEARAGQGGPAGIGVAAGEVGIGARAGPGRRWCACCSSSLAPARICRARSRSAGVSTPNGPCSTRATAIRMPASSARSCSSFSRSSSGLGGSATKRSSAARR